jgi:flagellar biosynthesis protein FlhA
MSLRARPAALPATSRPAAILAAGLLAVLVVMILPMPAWVIDIGLTLSFALAILVFTTALLIRTPLDFSSFPSVLLASLILRLSLNVASTKLIIAEGHTGTQAAGGVIEGFAMFIMGGDLFVGLVVFFVLIIVNFMVITKGASRMAEVGARFALDAMPGKQMAIDADLAVGALSHEEASRRRQRDQEEAAFLGSLDGASKFVKGDAMAGLLIMALNLLAGMGVGLLVHGLSFEEALANYSILTVGDGLVSQIPALIISVAAALLLSKGRDGSAIDTALGRQLISDPATLLIVAGALLIFAVLPGMPFIPFMLAAAGVGAGAFILRRKARAAAIPAAPTETSAAPAPVLGDSIHADEIHLEVAPDLVAVVLKGASGFDARITRIRRYIAQEYGFILPPVRMTDNPALERNAYRIRIQGVRVDGGVLRPGCVLALMEDNQLPHLRGEKVREPVYKSSARWLPTNQSQELAAAAVPVIEAPEVLATHLLEVIQSNFSLIFTRMVLMDTLDALTRLSDADRASANRRFLDEYIPAKVSTELLLSVMRALLEERVPVRNLFLILETIAEVKTPTTGLAHIVAMVRQRLSFQIIDRLLDDTGRLPLLQLSGDWEKRFAQHEVELSGGQSDIALPPEMFNALASSVQARVAEAAQKGLTPALITTLRRRRFLQTLMTSKGIRNAVLAYEEIGSRVKPYIVGTV